MYTLYVLIFLTSGYALFNPFTNSHLIEILGSLSWKLYFINKQIKVTLQIVLVLSFTTRYTLKYIWD